MLFFVLKVAILSAVFIFVVHRILEYFKDTLTVPKQIDLVQSTEKKYDEIQQSLKRLSSMSSLSSSTNIQSLKPVDPYGLPHPPHPPSSSSVPFMKNELKNFIKQI